jgi:hypothetical protein
MRATGIEPCGHALQIENVAPRSSEAQRGDGNRCGDTRARFSLVSQRRQGKRRRAFLTPRRQAPPLSEVRRPATGPAPPPVP